MATHHEFAAARIAELHGRFVRAMNVRVVGHVEKSFYVANLFWINLRSFSHPDLGLHELFSRDIPGSFRRRQRLWSAMPEREVLIDECLHREWNSSASMQRLTYRQDLSAKVRDRPKQGGAFGDITELSQQECGTQATDRANRFSDHDRVRDVLAKQKANQVAVNDDPRWKQRRGELVRPIVQSVQNGPGVLVSHRSLWSFSSNLRK